MAWVDFISVLCPDFVWDTYYSFGSETEQLVMRNGLEKFLHVFKHWALTENKTSVIVKKFPGSNISNMNKLKSKLE